MLNIPPEILDRFLAILGKIGVPSAQYVYYRKWLRYYLDFCRKYRLEPASVESPPLFQAKLREKKQTEPQIRQAAQAVSLFCELQDPLKWASPPARAKPLPMAAEASNPYGPAAPVPTGKPAGMAPKDHRSPVERTSWDLAIGDLVGIIKTKHYSPKTLKPYAHWARKLQDFKTEKEPSSLSSEGVNV